MSKDVLAAAARYRKIEQVEDVRSAMKMICAGKGYEGWSVFAAEDPEDFCLVVESLFDMVEELGK
jgi:hypothetical protein